MNVTNQSTEDNVGDFSDVRLPIKDVRLKDVGIVCGALFAVPFSVTFGIAAGIRMAFWLFG